MTCLLQELLQHHSCQRYTLVQDHIIEIRLKLSASTNKTLEIDKTLEIAILPKPKTFPLELSPVGAP